MPRKRTNEVFGKDYFEGAAYESYLKSRENYQRKAKIYLKHLMKYKSHGRLIDVGCAHGFFLDVFKEKFEVYGMDVSEYGIEQARRFLPEVQDHLVCQDCQEKWPYPDNCFDVVVAYDVMEHIKHLSRMIGQAYRCLKPGGIFMFSIANPLYIILPRFLPYLFTSRVLEYVSLTNGTVYLKHSWELKALLSDFVIIEKIRKPTIGKLSILEHKLRIPLLKTIGKFPIFNSSFTWICKSRKT